MTECDLKPCPFCGHEPMFGKVRPATRKSPPLFGITCIHCGAEMTDEFVPELIRRWNARAAATASIDKEVMEGAFDKERRDVAAHLFPCTRCTHLTTCDRTTGTDVYSADADWCGEFEEA